MTPKKPKEALGPVMRASERSALSKIIDQRFRVLAEEIDQREEDIGELVRNRIIEEGKQAVPEAKQRMAPLIERARHLQQEANAELKKIEQELGVVPGTVTVVNDREYDVSDYEQARRQRRQQRIVNVKRVQQSQATPLSVHVDNDHYSAPNVEKRTREALRKLGLDASKGRRRLERKRLDLQEQLLLGALESSDARAFLDKIPTIESILPKPTDQQLIEVGT